MMTRDTLCRSQLPGPVYIMGPMSGLPEYNYPAFNAEAARLRALGIEVRNPAETPPPVGLPIDSPESYRYFIVAGLKLLSECQSAVALPGWRQSRGCTVESVAARAWGIRLFEAEGLLVRETPW